MDKIRIVLGGRWFLHQELRGALARKQEIDVVAEARDGEETLYQVKALLPDVVILDAGPAAFDGIALTWQIKRYSPVISVILVASDEDDETLLRAIQAGAAGFFSISSEAADLAEMVLAVSRGKYPINEIILSRPKLALHIMKQFQTLLLMPKELEPHVSPLTHRETEILTHIALGKSNKQISSLLGISNQTVKNHMTSILRKLAANDRAHAVVLAMRQGLIKVH